jgi:hypothetical protein
MKSQTNVFTDSSDSEEEEYEKCNHEYTVKLYGFMTCLTCG